MLGTIRISAVMIGIAGGALVAAAVFLVGLLIARGVGADQGPALVLSVSLLSGLAAGGFLAGRVAPFNGRFHGSITGLGMAGVILIISLLGGSPAPTSQVVLLSAIAIVVGGLSGWLGGRQRYKGGASPPGDRGSPPHRQLGGGSRKVRTPQGTVLGNSQAGRPDG